MQKAVNNMTLSQQVKNGRYDSFLAYIITHYQEIQTSSLPASLAK